MERKKKFEVVGALLVLVALAFLLWWLLGRGTTEPTTNLPTTTEQAGETPTETPTTSEPRIQATTAPTIARAFVERLGSFSTESGYKNIDDVMILASAGLQNDLKNLKASALKSPAKSYYGVSTRVVTIETESESAQNASIKITTSRTESINDPRSQTVRYQDITLNLVKSGNTWLVEDYSWLE